MFKSFFILLVGTSLLLSCAQESSDDDSSSSTSITSVKDGLDLASEKMEAFIPESTTFSAASSKRTDKTSINSEWTDTNYALGGDSGSTPQAFVENHGDEDNEDAYGLMYRFAQAMENLCVFTSALPTGDDGFLDLSAANTVTLTTAKISEIEANCDTTIDVPADTVVGYKVEDISANTGTQYERKVSFDMNGGTAFTDFFYYTMNNTTVRMAFVEDSTNDSVAMFDYSSADEAGRFEFTEVASTFSIHYRVFMDEGSGQGNFLVYRNINDPKFAKASVTTQEGGGDLMAVSYAFSGDGSSLDLDDGNACVSTTDFSVSTDNTLTCSDITGTAVSSWTTDLSPLDAGSATYSVTGLDETSFFNFESATDLYTADLAD